jgi:hypothetical protein
VFTKDINAPEVERINKSLDFLLLCNVVQSLKVFLLQFNILEVGDDTRFSNRLGNDNITTVDTPRDKDLSSSGVVFFSNFKLI